MELNKVYRSDNQSLFFYHKEANMKLLKNIYRVIFSRTTITIILLIIQIYLFYLGYYIFKEHILLFFGGNTILSLITVIYILNTKENSAFKMAWIIPVLALPVFGTLMYIWVKAGLIPKKLNKKLEKLKLKSATYINNDIINSKDIPTDIKRLSHYLYQKHYFPMYSNAKIKYFSPGKEYYEDLLIELKKANKFIFLEFFIIGEGEMWNSILDILKDKVKSNVEVRVMYDGTCEISQLPRNYIDILKSYGIKAKVYAPLKPFISTYHNNRDHRKIVVIDGVTSYTGGINLADEYIGKKIRFGCWKDNAIKICGEATNRYTLLFLEMWNINTKQIEDFRKYITSNDIKEDGYIIPYGDNPFDREYLAKNIVLDIVNGAKEYIHIMTPYLILDDELITSLTLASKKGIEVIIIMPHIPDKMYAYLLARTYYEELIETGIKIYEFTAGFVHAKTIISDDIKLSIGSVNLDYRSLYLNFECGAYIYSNKVIKKAEKDFQSTLKKCQLVTLKNCKELNILCKVIGKILRLIAPLM